MSNTGATSYIGNIDVTYPLPGQDNNSQGFRSNFNNIQRALSTLDDYMGQLAATTLNIESPYVTATVSLSTLGSLVINRTTYISTGDNYSTVIKVPSYNNNVGAAGSIAFYANTKQAYVTSVASGGTSFTVNDASGVMKNAGFTDVASNTYTVASILGNTITPNTAITDYGGWIGVTFTNPQFGKNVNKTVNTAVTKAVNDNLPIGAIIMWYGISSAIPAGWHVCNGGGGTPDLRSKFIIGANGDQGSFSNAAVGVEGGTRDAVIPYHTHSATASVTENEHKHNLGSKAAALPDATSIDGSESQGFIRDFGVGGGPSALSSGAKTGLTVAVSVDSVGTSGNVTDANLPPYYALYYIMKITNYAYAVYE
jgi:hypothetical protein